MTIGMRFQGCVAGRWCAKLRYVYCTYMDYYYTYKYYVPTLIFYPSLCANWTAHMYEYYVDEESIYTRRGAPYPV